MAYIESFLLYVGVVFLCGIVLLAGLFVILFIFLLIKTVIKSKKDDFSEINQIFKNINQINRTFISIICRNIHLIHIQYLFF